MSYKVTVYFNDADIASTEIYYPRAGHTVTMDYGDSAYSAEGFDGTTIFTAYPDDGCYFTKWYYRIGDDIYDETIPPRESTDNPFTYSGTEDIVIRAEGETEPVEPPEETPWGEYFEEINTIFVNFHDEYADVFSSDITHELEPYCIHRFKVEFAHSGYAHFFTESNIDTIGYLSDEPDWNSDYSGPLSDIASDDNSGEGKNFDIKYYVRANTPYYIFVRGCTGEESGYVTLYVTAPWQLNSFNYGILDGAHTENIPVNPLTLYRREMFFSESGTVTISASVGEIWIGKSEEWKYAMPTDYFAASNKMSNNSFSCEVTTNQVYFVWVKCGAAPSATTTTLNISAPTSTTTVNKWSWYDSNGSADADETYASYLAVVNKEITTNFFHEVWNDLVKKVDDTLRANGIEWDTTYAPYDNTLMPSYPYELTADMFNSLRNNLKFVYDSGISKVEPGDDVLGSYFTTLAQSMNNAIDEL